MVNLKDNVITLTKEELCKNVKDENKLDMIHTKDFTKEQAKQDLINRLSILDYTKKKGPENHMFGKSLFRREVEYQNRCINNVCNTHNLKFEINDENNIITIMDKDTAYIIEKINNTKDSRTKYKEEQKQESKQQEHAVEQKQEIVQEQKQESKQQVIEQQPQVENVAKPLNTAMNQQEYTNNRIASAIDKIANGDINYLQYILNSICKGHEQEVLSCVNQLKLGNIDKETFKSAMMAIFSNNLNAKNVSNIINSYQEPFIILNGNEQYVDPYGNTIYKFSDGSLKYYNQLSYKDIEDMNKNQSNDGLENMFNKINSDVRPVVKLSMEEIALHNPQVMQQIMMNQQIQQQVQPQQPSLDSLIKQAGLPDSYKVLDPDSINEIIKLNEAKTGSTVRAIVDRLLEEGLIPVVRFYMGKTNMISLDVNNHRMYVDIYGAYYDAEEKIIFQIGYNVYGYDPENDMDIVVKYLKNEMSDADFANESFVSDDLLELNTKVNLATFPDTIEDRYGFFANLSKIFKGINTHGKQFQCIKSQFKDEDKFMLARTEDINNLCNIIRCLQITKSKVEIKDLSKEEFVKLG